MKEKNEEKHISRHVTEKQIQIARKHEEMLKLSDNQVSKIKAVVKCHISLSNRQKCRYKGPSPVSDEDGWGCR